MAGSFKVASQQRTIQVIGATQVVDVMEIGAFSEPSNVYFQRYVPFASWQLLNGPQGLGFWLQPVADAIEDSLAAREASGVAFLQDIDPSSGLLTDYLDFTVSYMPPGGLLPMTTTVRYPIDNLVIEFAGGELVGLSDALAEARSQLQTVAGA